MKATLWIVIMSALTALVLSGCTKKRSDRFAQGQGINLNTVSQLGGQTYLIKTTDKLMDAPVTVAKERIIEGDGAKKSFGVDGTKGVINHFNYVNWSSDSELLNLGQHVRIRGLENSQYEVRYVLSGENVLKVLKVGTPETIPYEEMPYAIELENGLVGIPLVGYEVSWVRAEKILNADYEETNEYREVPVNTKAEATHYKINKNKPTVFDAVSKQDFYPVKYFTEGEWYFTAFYHTNAPGSRAMPGSSCILGGWGNPTMKVKFDKLESGLVGRNLHIAKEIDHGRKIDKQSVVKLAGDFTQTRVKAKGSDLGVGEEEDETIAKHKREFIKLDLKSITTVCNPVASGDDLEITKLTVGKDYFGYTVNDDKQGVLVTYSFWRKEADKPGEEYEIKTFHQNDYKHFGMFMTSEAMYLNDPSRYTEEDIRKGLRVARFNPKKPIVWYLTSQSPVEMVVRDSAKKSVEYWQSAFTEAGTAMTISFVDPIVKCPNLAADQKLPKTMIRMSNTDCWDTTKTRDAGDIRYNTINFLPDTSVGLLGYGPSNQDIYTGETISAHSQIYYGNFRNQIIRQVRRYIRTNLGKFNDSVVNVGPFDIHSNVNSGHSSIGLDSPTDFGNILQWQAPSIDKLAKMKNADLDFNFGPFEVSKYHPTQTRKIVSSVPKKTAHKSHIPEHLLKIFPSLKAMEETKHIHNAGGGILDNDYSLARRIAANCPELSKKNLASKFPNKDITSNVEYGLILPCMRRLIENRLIGTIVHEMGHNFGLAHNFAASFDADNHWTHEQYKNLYGFNNYESEVPRSTSIMEYIDDTRTQEMVAPGPYDIGVLRFGYSTGCADGTTTCSRIPLKGSKTEYVEAKNGQSLDDAIAASGKSRKDLQLFRYCQDETREAFCKTHDTGTSATEIARNYIDSFKASIAFGTKRLDKALVNENQAMNRVQAFSFPLRRLYDHWRIRLFEILNSKQINPQYFNGLSDQDKNILISVLRQTQDPKHLAKMSKGQYAVIISAIEGGAFSQLEEYKGEFADLLKTRRMIFDFFTDISLLPNKYCVISRNIEGKEYFDAVEFEMIRETLKYTAGTISSCSDKLVTDYYARSGIQIKGEMGLPMYNTRYSLDDRNKNWYSLPVDEVGVALDRQYAIQLIAGRFAQYRKQFELNQFPNMLDEPDFRDELFDKLKNRILVGQKLNLTEFGGGEIMVRRFHFEREILPSLARFYTQGLSVPGNLTETLRRLEPFQSIAARNRFWIQSSPAATEEGGVVFAVQSLRANQAREIIQRHKYFNDIADGNQLPAEINRLLVYHLFGMMKQFLPKDDSAINLNQMYGLGSFLQRFTEGPTLPNLVEANAEVFKIDMSDKQKAAQQIANIVVPVQWFLRNQFHYDMLIYNSVLVETVNGERVGLPERMKQLTDDENLAKQMDSQWNMVMHRYQNKLGKLSPIIDQINKLAAEVQPAQKKLAALDTQMKKMAASMMLKTSEIARIKASWTKPEDCAADSQEPKCQHPQKDQIAKLESELKAERVEFAATQQEIATLKAAVQTKMDKLAALNEDLEKHNYTDMTKMLSDAYNNVIASQNNVRQAQAMKKAFDDRLAQLRQLNFANIYHGNLLPIHTLKNTSAESFVANADIINEEAGWARQYGIREKDAQQNMLIQFLLSMSGAIY